jgi:hypothetical protein
MCYILFSFIFQKALMMDHTSLAVEEHKTYAMDPKALSEQNKIAKVLEQKYLTLVNACRVVAMYEKLAINFLHYCTTPKKLLTLVAIVGLGYFTMNSTFAGSFFS